MNVHLRKEDVDGGAEEDWGDGDANCEGVSYPSLLSFLPSLRNSRGIAKQLIRTDLHQKPIKVKRVVVDDHPANVSNNLQQAPADHAQHESPSLRPHALPCVQER